MWLSWWKGKNWGPPNVPSSFVENKTLEGAIKEKCLWWTAPTQYPAPPRQTSQAPPFIKVPSRCLHLPADQIPAALFGGGRVPTTLQSGHGVPLLLLVAHRLLSSLLGAGQDQWDRNWTKLKLRLVVTCWPSAPTMLMLNYKHLFWRREYIRIGREVKVHWYIKLN